jgi:hypothetical protein
MFFPMFSSYCFQRESNSFCPYIFRYTEQFEMVMAIHFVRF